MLGENLGSLLYGNVSVMYTSTVSKGMILSLYGNVSVTYTSTVSSDMKFKFVRKCFCDIYKYSQ